MTTPRKAEMTATGFGPFVEASELELPLEPIVVLNGPNGVGKSTFLRLLRRLLGDDKTTPERTRDSAAPGTASLSVGDRRITLTLRQKYSLTGDVDAFPLRLARGEGQLLADLIGPTNDDSSKTAPARAARVRALARLADIAVDRKTLEHLASGLEVDLSGWKDSTDVVAVADELKRRLETVKRKHSEEAATHEGALQVLEHQLSELPPGSNTPPTLTLEQATARVQEAQRLVYEVEASAKARQEQETARAKLQTDLPAPTWDAMHRTVSLLEDELKRTPLEAAWQAIDDVINELRAVMHVTRAQAITYKETARALSAPITGATIEDVQATRETYSLAGQAKAMVQHHASFQRLSVEKEQREQLSDLARERATLYETAAKAVHQRLAEIIREAGLEVLSLSEDGEVVTHSAGAPVPYATRSLGERVFDAVCACAGGLETDDRIAVLTLAPDHWGALDDASRAVLRIELDRFAGRLVVLTEEPDSSIDRIAATSAA